jgi:hypothetical protein
MLKNKWGEKRDGARKVTSPSPAHGHLLQVQYDWMLSQRTFKVHALMRARDAEARMNACRAHAQRMQGPCAAHAGPMHCLGPQPHMLTR